MLFAEVNHDRVMCRLEFMLDDRREPRLHYPPSQSELIYALKKIADELLVLMRGIVNGMRGVGGVYTGVGG